MRKHVVLGMVALGAATATSASELTPYDLIRPVYPLNWDTTAFDKFDTTVTKRTGMLPLAKKPDSFKANGFIPDTLDQAYLDAINSHISPIRVNQAGYLTSDKERQFYYIGTATTFEVVDADGKSLSPAVTGDFTMKTTQTSSNWTIIAKTDATGTDNNRYKVDFTGPSNIIKIGNIPQSVPTDKRLRIKIDNDVSSTFIVSDNVYSMVRDAALKFYGIQRSGNSESWFHAASHTKDGGGPVVTDAKAELGTFDESLAGTLQGGYYDCGDHLKESMTQMHAFMISSLMAATNADKDKDHYAFNQGEAVNTDGIPDMLREARHGAEFVLRAYNRAKGVIDDMALSVGEFGSDHGWWNRPENQDALPTDTSLAGTGRGGPAARTVRLGEIGSNVGGETAAGLALVGKLYANYDKAFADSCLKVAEEMYDFAKALAQGKDSYGNGKPFKNNKLAAGWSTPAYNGNNEFYDEMALASVALLYATGKKEYAKDAFGAEKLIPEQNSISNAAGSFEGGWFATPNKGFLKNPKNTNWANSYAFATYALYKLILADKTTATTTYGLSETEWLNAIEDCIASMIYNLGDVSLGNGAKTIELPSGGIGWKSTSVKYDATWYIMQTDQAWQFNSYQAGNIFEVLAYADVAADIAAKGITLPNMASPNWKADEMKQLGINQLNYLLGMNPWDISFVYGIGDKNDAHPHHRAANPEGRNADPAYKYRVPVGALFGGIAPGTENALVPENNSSVDDYHVSEACLDGSAILMAATTIVSNSNGESSTQALPQKKKAGVWNKATIALESSALQIHAPGNGNKTIQVFDLLGNTVYKANFYGDNLNVPLNEMRHKGALQVRVTNGGKIAAQKAIRVK